MRLGGSRGHMLYFFEMRDSAYLFFTHIAHSRTCAQLVYLKKRTSFDHIASFCVCCSLGEFLSSDAHANREGTAGPGGADPP